MEEIVKKYLEEHCEKDTALAEKFNAELIPKCCEYIYKMAEETHDNETCIAIEDHIVFKWARDYFIEGEAALEEERRRKREAEEAERKAREEEAERERVKKELYEREHKNGQICLFDFPGV